MVVSNLLSKDKLRQVGQNFGTTAVYSGRPCVSKYNFWLMTILLIEIILIKF